MSSWTDLETLLRQITALVGSRSVGAVLTLLSTLLIARLSSPEQFGAFMTCVSWAMILSIGLSLNIEAGSIRYLVRYRETGQSECVSGFLNFNLCAVFAFTALAATLTIASVAASGLDFASLQDRRWIWVLLIAPLLALTRIYGRHGTAVGAVVRGAVPRTLVRPALFLLLLGAVTTFGIEFTVEGFCGSFLLAALIATLLQIWLVKSPLRGIRNQTSDYSDWGAWIRTGTMMAPLLLVRENFKNLIVISAGLSLAADKIGILALALTIVSFVHFSLKAVDVSISPRLSKAIHSGNEDRTNDLLRVGGALKLAGAALSAAIIYFGDNWLLGVFGNEYAEAIEIARLLMMVPLVDALVGPAHMVLNITGRPEPVCKIASISAFIIVAATVAGGALAGLEGAAIAAAAAFAVQQLSLWAVCRVQTGLNTSPLNKRWARLQISPKTS